MVGNFEQTVEHAMYLGRELQKAELCLKNQLSYNQDEDLEIKKEIKKEEPVSTNKFGWFD